MHRGARVSLGSVVSSAAIGTFLAVSLIGGTANAGLKRPAPPVNSAAGTPDPNTFIVGYFDVSESSVSNGTGAGDNVVSLINATSNNPICAMIYVFDDDQELGECCGCPLSSNKLLKLSVINQLTSNWEIANFDFGNGALKIVSATPNGCTPKNSGAGCHGGCDPSAVYTQAPALEGSILKPQSVRVPPETTITDLTETNMFKEGAPDSTELGTLVSKCAALIGPNPPGNGSGLGACNCGPESEVFVTAGRP
jgi:hypothetical protein